MASKTESTKKASENGSAGTSEEGTKTCFVIARINDHASSERRQTDGLLRAVIEPALLPLKMKVTAAHILDQSGSISRQIIERLLNADLVIADITGHNPNVMYELGVRHAARKPVVILREVGTRIPFDVQSDRVVDYRNDFLGTIELQREVRAKSQSALSDSDPDNPVYAAAEQSVIKEIVGREGNDVQQALMSTLVSIEERLSRSGIGDSSTASSYIHVTVETSSLNELRAALDALGCRGEPNVSGQKDGSLYVTAGWDVEENSLRAIHALELIENIPGTSNPHVDTLPF